MKNMIPARNQKGFTLIELVMVIVILGILAAFALPRFADFGTEAKVATLNGAAGSVKSAAAIAHARWVADGSTASAPVNLDGATGITMSAAGYPTSDAAGIGTAAQLSDEFTITDGTDVSTDAATISLDASSGTCEFDYDPTTGNTTLNSSNNC